MAPQRYERVSGNDDSSSIGNAVFTPNSSVPTSPPPSFRSRASSPTSRHLLSQDPLVSDADQALAASFDPNDGSDSEADDDDDDNDQRRLMRPSSSRRDSGDESVEDAEVDQPSSGREPRPGAVARRVTELPVFNPPPGLVSSAMRRVYGGGSRSTPNDGVFANLSAKPERGEKEDEKPPTYEQAAADATPPYWETTILAPGMTGDEVYVDGLPVGSVFSFVWNGTISMFFPLVGFLLTYLLHTSHAAKNGSKAGLGITLVRWGFSIKGQENGFRNGSADDAAAYGEPPDPNSHDFDPATIASGAAAAAAAAASNSAGSMIEAHNAGKEAGSRISHFGGTDFLSYGLMIVGWFILIRAISSYLRARRHEQLVLQSPDRGLGIPVVAEGEGAETVV
ncbi:MAG: hypothetical protein M1829_001842 [Trizodia sp. TS-e1964]|nr:MAG: hypothetical protein M1829_001842 [Trizodia sp. TS-e1964]